jgi:hypothetical protein
MLTDKCTFYSPFGDTVIPYSKTLGATLFSPDGKVAQKGGRALGRED